MIIDCHTHLDDITHTGKKVQERLKALLKTLKQNKVDKAFVLADIPFPHDKHFLTNEEFIALIKPYKQLKLVGKVPLRQSTNKKYLQGIKKHLEQKELVGIKLYPGYEPFYAHDKRYGKVYDLCEQYDVPVMMHTGDVMEEGYLKYATPLHVDELATKRQDLKIIMCHMGSPWQLDAAAVTFKNENVYADTAGLFSKKLDATMQHFLHHKIEEFIEWNGKAEKLVFGTDWPITPIKDTITLINSLHLSNKEKHLIFCGNAKKLFRIR
jgi:hypothetical protein